MTTHKAPIINLTVESERITHIQDGVYQSTEWAINDVMQSIRMRINDGIADAYRHGVIDGFQQGCIAESQHKTDKEAKGVASDF